jgi:hypothetical protein
MDSYVTNGTFYLTWVRSLPLEARAESPNPAPRNPSQASINSILINTMAV